MFERFTEKAVKVIMLAQGEALNLGHTAVSPEFIFLGLLGSTPTIPSKVLSSMGVDLKQARMEIEKQLGRGSGIEESAIPFTPDSKRLLENSWEEAKKLQVNYIGTEHLLLGLLSIENASLKLVFKALGLQPDKLKQSTFIEIENPPDFKDRQEVKDTLLEEFPPALDVIKLSKERLIKSQQFELAAQLSVLEVDLVEHLAKITKLIRSAANQN